VRYSWRLPLTLGFLALLACGEETPPGSSAGDASAGGGATAAAFQAFVEETYTEDMARYPLTASYRGIKARNDQWNSVSEAFLEESRAIDEARLARLQTFDRAALDDSAQLSRDLFRLDLERSLARDAFRHHHHVITHHYGPHTAVPSTLINIHRMNDLEDAQDYIGRLRNVDSYFDGVIEQLGIRTEKGLVLVDWMYPKIVEAARNVISGAPHDEDAAPSALWADFRDKVTALAVDAATREQLLAEGRQALVAVVEPAYERLIAAVERQAAEASAADGVWRLPNGKAYYAQRLAWYTTTELSADEIHQLGLAEVARIHEEMRGIMAQVDFEGSLGEFFTFMREDGQFYYPNTDAGREAYLKEARRLIDAMGERLPDYFGLLPAADIVVKRVEPFRERSAGKAFYSAPPPDGSRPGIYYANLYNMADMPKYQMEALAFHEGVPGHHMQRAITVALDDIPEFQKYASFTAFTEGWGLYSEELAKEMGFYRDPYSDFGRLAMELWRACRLVVDTGIHSKRWNREEAIDYLLENTPNSRGDSIKAIERYIAMPGQATAYMIGKLKLMELREEARLALGEDFDIRAFHDEVLKDGPVPLSILERKIEGLRRAP
jgi:uncharacterized protein (DUF885 family)